VDSSGLDTPGSKWGPVIGACEDDNESSGSVRLCSMESVT
jgi:hypothetical protein